MISLIDSPVTHAIIGAVSGVVSTLIDLLTQEKLNITLS